MLTDANPRLFLFCSAFFKCTLYEATEGLSWIGSSVFPDTGTTLPSLKVSHTASGHNHASLLLLSWRMWFSASIPYNPAECFNFLFLTFCLIRNDEIVQNETFDSMLPFIFPLSSLRLTGAGFSRHSSSKCDIFFFFKSHSVELITARLLSWVTRASSCWTHVVASLFWGR